MDGATLPPKLGELLATLALFPDRADRIQFLISVADRYREVPSRLASRPFPEERRVPQCESEAFAWAEDRGDGTLDYYFAVDNPQGISAKAFAAILQEGLSGVPLEEVIRIPGDLVLAIFGRELSMGKHLGLVGMLQMAQVYARRRLRERQAAASVS